MSHQLFHLSLWGLFWFILVCFDSYIGLYWFILVYMGLYRFILVYIGLSLASNHRCLMLDARCLMLDAWCLMHAWWFMAHGSRLMAHGSWPRKGRGGLGRTGAAPLSWPWAMSLEPLAMNHQACIKHQALRNWFRDSGKEFRNLAFQTLSFLWENFFSFGGNVGHRRLLLAGFNSGKGYSRLL